jgi:hypothetical protein
MVEIFAWMHRISPAGMGAFKARLRKLQSEEVPQGSRPGKGARVDYDLPMVAELAIALELLQSGLSPHDAAALIKTNRQDFYSACLLGLSTDLAEADDPFVLISPVAVEGYPAQVDGRQFALLGAVSFVTRTMLVDRFAKRAVAEPTSGDSWRWLILDLRRTTHYLLAALTRDDKTSDVIFDTVISEWERDAPHRSSFKRNRLNKVSEIPLPLEGPENVDP